MACSASLKLEVEGSWWQLKKLDFGTPRARKLKVWEQFGSLRGHQLNSSFNAAGWYYGLGMAFYELI
ncbi:hypothetical protein V2J09_021784 [Rumex salicifolius]